MATDHPPRGKCPRCGTSIRACHLLIEYETSDGQAAYAGCPGCHDVVHPS